MFNPFEYAFGLDIGDRTFKLVQVKKRRGLQKYRLTAWNQVEVPAGMFERGEITDAEKAAALIREMLATAHGKVRGAAVAACLPEPKTFIKIIDAVGAPEDGLRKAVRKEIEQTIPLPPDEVAYDWQTISAPAALDTEKAGGLEGLRTGESSSQSPPALQPSGSPATPAPKRVLIGAAPKTLVNSYVDLLERAGLAPFALEIEADSIARALVPLSKYSEEALGLLDIGGTRSSLIIHDGGTVQMSISVPVSGQAITDTISTTLDIEVEEAERIKLECGLDAGRCDDKLWKVLLPLIDDLVEKIRNALRFYKASFPSGRKIETVLLCGGGATFRDVDTVLARKLAVKVRRGDPLINLERALPADFPKNMAPAFATAIGLAIRAADEIESLMP